MNNNQQFLLHKLEGIHHSLMRAHADSANYAPSITGAEREIVNKQLLSLIIPPSYRVGTGTIIDQHKDESGQVDIVIEQPFSLSFPVSSDSNRLYLAPSVCAAFEVKSDLSKQGDEGMEKIKKIKELHRIPVKAGEHYNYDDISIPSFLIGFKGPDSEEGIDKIYGKFSDRLIPNGILCIESGIFYGREMSSKDWLIASGKAASLFAFLQCVTDALQSSGMNRFTLSDFSSVLKAPLS